MDMAAIHCAKQTNTETENQISLVLTHVGATHRMHIVINMGIVDTGK